MSSEFDWFMVTMPIFAIVVYLIVMVGAMEKQPKFLEEAGVKKVIALLSLDCLRRRYSHLFLLHDQMVYFLVGNY